MIIQYECKSTNLQELLEPYKKRIKEDPPLTCLQVSHSRIKSLVNSPSSLRSLRMLKVNFCELVSLKGVGQFALLQTLEAKYNRITDLSALRNSCSLSNLNLVGNPVCENRRDFFQTIRDMQLGIQQLNGQHINIYEKLVGNQLNKRNASAKIVSFKSIQRLPQITALSTTLTQIASKQIKPNSHSIQNTTIIQGLRLKKCPLPIFESQSYFCQPTIQISSENDGNTFQFNNDNDANTVIDNFDKLRQLPRSEERFNSIKRENDKALNLPVYIEDDPYHLSSSHQTEQDVVFENQLTKNWLIQCFYALKYWSQLSRAYRKNLRKSVRQPLASKIMNNLKSKVQISLDIDMINETAESEWRNKTMK